MSRVVLRWTSVLFLFSSTSLGAGVSVTDFGAIPNDGRDDTAAFTAAANAGDVIAFQPGTTGVVSGLTIVGPSNVSKYGCNAILHFGGTGGSLTVDRCTVSRGRTGVKMEELNGRQDRPQLLITDSLLEAPTCTLMLNSGSCNVVRTTFRGYGRSGSNQDHAIYSYFPVNLAVDGCVFGGNLGYGFDVHPYSPAVPGSGSVSIRNSSFAGSSTGNGILTHPVTQTTIDGCQLGTTPVYVRRGGAVLSSSTLQSATQVKPWPYDPGTWTFVNCTFGG